MLVSHRFALVLAVATLAAGCGSDARSADDEDTAAAQAPLDGPAGPEGRPGAPPPMGGPGLLFGVALHELDLSSEERATIEEIARDARPPMPNDDGKRAALAAAIRDGSIDPSALAPTERGMLADHAGHRAKLVAALQKLHDSLDADQRSDLAERVASKLDEMAARGAPPPPPEGGKGGDRLGPMGMLLDGIVTNQAQKTRIAEALEKANLGKPAPRDMPPPDEMASHMKEMVAIDTALVRAFAADKFDASAALPEPPMGAPPHMGPPPGRFLEELQVVVPLLDASQREALAARIEKGPPPLH